MLVYYISVWRTFMMLMMSLGPILFGSNSTSALPVARATEADLMPLLVANVRSMRLIHDEQLMPDTWMMKHSNITCNIIIISYFFKSQLQ